jgi:hypothetical protein
MQAFGPSRVPYVVSRSLPGPAPEEMPPDRREADEHHHRVTWLH